EVRRGCRPTGHDGGEAGRGRLFLLEASGSACGGPGTTGMRLRQRGNDNGGEAAAWCTWQAHVCRSRACAARTRNPEQEESRPVAVTLIHPTPRLRRYPPPPRGGWGVGLP